MISLLLRVSLILVSIWLFCYIFRSVQRGKVQIDDIIFWMSLSALLVILAVVPQIAYYAAEIFGVQSPINFIYLIIIFILLLKLFTMSVKMSQLEIKVNHLVQELAVEKCLEESAFAIASEVEDNQGE